MRVVNSKLDSRLCLCENVQSVSLVRSERGDFP